MYVVDLELNKHTYPIHNEKIKLINGTVKQGINVIDSFSFTITPNNVGFNNIRDFKTLISVYNEKRKRYEFQGRVLYSGDSMNSDGLIIKSVVCESFLGYLQDSRQDYVYERNWTPTELLTTLLNVHNSLTEEEKHFKVGNVFTNENIYIGIQRESTWECINKKIIEKIGGEIQLRVEDDGMYIDIVKERGVTRATTIELSKNMKAITKDSDPSSYITRLIPLGAKIKDENGNDTEERIDIKSVNGGKNYIDDELAISNYGIHIEYQYWDDVHEPNILKTKATSFLTENNKVLQKYKIDTLDLALIGIDIDYIDVCNYYPVKNKLLGVNDTLRVITKTIDIVNESTTSVEIGDKFKSLSDLEIERNQQIIENMNVVKKIESDYVTNKSVTAIIDQYLNDSTIIEQTAESVVIGALMEYVEKTNFNEYKESNSTELQVLAEQILANFNSTTSQIENVDGDLQSKYQELSSYIRGYQNDEGQPVIELGESQSTIKLKLENDEIYFEVNGVKAFYLTAEGKIVFKNAVFEETTEVGNGFGFVPRSNGNISFKKVRR